MCLVKRRKSHRVTSHRGGHPSVYLCRSCRDSTPRHLIADRTNTRIRALFSGDRADTWIRAIVFPDRADTRIRASFSADRADTRIRAYFAADRADTLICAYFFFDRSDTRIRANFSAVIADSSGTELADFAAPVPADSSFAAIADFKAVSAFSADQQSFDSRRPQTPATNVRKCRRDLLRTTSSVAS